MVVPNTNMLQCAWGYKWAVRRRDIPHINVGLFRFEEEAKELLIAVSNPVPSDREMASLITCSAMMEDEMTARGCSTLLAKFTGESDEREQERFTTQRAGTVRMRTLLDSNLR